MSTLELPLLKALNQAAATLLNEPDTQKGASEALALVGKASGVDRVYIFENTTDPEMVALMSQRFEWVQDSVTVQLDNPELQNLPYEEAGFGRWYQELSSRRQIGGLIQDFPISEQGLLEAQDILSILVLPIFIDDYFWGFVGFDDCSQERLWAVEEVEILFNLANTLGSFFQRQRYESSLLHIKSQLEEAQRIAQIGNWRYDRKTQDLDLSKGIHRILGTQPGFGFSSGNIHQFFEGSALSNLLGSIYNLIQSRDPLDITLPAKTFTGTPIWVRLIAEAIEFEGELRYLQGVLMDVSNEVHMQQALIKAKERAEKADRAKSEFLSTMSHEIRTPLNAVIGYAHLLLAENPRPDQQEYLETLQFSSESLLALINDILDYSKIEAGKIELESTPIRLQTMLAGIIQGQLPVAEEKGLALTINIDEQVPAVILSDPVRLGQVLTNLASNAVKFTHHGGVSLRVKWLAGNDKEGTLRFEVQDTGIGISPDQQEKIFEQFSQASSSTTRHFGGTGLGLAITKRILELLGSRIQLRSQPNKGSCFWFDLSVPVRFEALAPIQGMSPKTPPPTPSGYQPLQQVHILIVEDNPVNIKVLQRFLKKWGVDHVQVAKNGQEAVDRVEQEPFDLILMDLNMPVMNGYDATRIIRQSHLDVPIIALTAEAMPDVQQKVLDAGMSDYATKPFNPQHLYQKVCKFTGVQH